MNNRISKWNRWDLHIHTRASNAKKANTEYKGEGLFFNDAEIEEFVDAVFPEKTPKLIAITDHDVFDSNQFLKIKDAAKRKSVSLNQDLCVLPGVECDVYFKVDEKNQIIVEDDVPFNQSKRVHIILIFNDTEWKNEKYVQLQNILDTKYINDDPIYINDLLLKFVQCRFEFVAIPHFTKDNGIEDAVPDKHDNKPIPENMETKTNWILSAYFPLLDAAPKDFTQIQIIHFYDQLFKKVGYRIPEILTSDNHDYKLYSKDTPLSWYKAFPSFKGLKMCCSDYDMRVRISPDAPKSSYISKITIASKNDAVNDSIIELSDNLNCVIGGRSSGKSLLLKQIMKASGSENAEKELASYKKAYKDFEVKLYDSNGVLYRGKPEYISQGSIIEKYLSKDGSENLATDFKDFFPKNIDFESISKEKEEIINSVTKINSYAFQLSEQSKNLREKNILDYLKINKVSFKNTISNKQLIAHYNYAEKTVNNLEKFIKLTNDNLSLITPYHTLYSKYKNLLNESCNQFKSSSLKLKEYEIVKNASSKLIEFLDNKAQGYDKKEKTQMAALQSLTDHILEWDKCYTDILDETNHLRTFMPSLKQSNSYFNETGNFKFSVKITNDLKITDLLDIYLDHIKTKLIKENVKSFVQIPDKVIANEYEVFLTKNLRNSLTTLVEEAYKVEYLIYEKGELINNMSEGRKASVFFNILLNKNDSIEPLIIDQPEDDMDNKDIYSILVNALRERKTGRQIILATHDSNIVVNGDAENVIYASKEKKKTRITYTYGGLEYEGEDINIQSTICDVLEGGEQAFINRAYKYDIDKTKIYKWRN